MDNRIVNGYPPKRRPWMANVKGRQSNNAEFDCGGSIINKRWILSAAHCFCPQLPCKASGKGSLELNVKPSDHLRVFIGDNQKYRMHHSDGEKFRFVPQKIIIHPLYRYETQFHDLALIKVDRDIAFSKNIMPICLPKSGRFPDTTGAVYVAGWGLLNELLPCKTTGEVRKYISNLAKTSPIC